MICKAALSGSSVPAAIGQIRARNVLRTTGMAFREPVSKNRLDKLRSAVSMMKAEACVGVYVSLESRHS